MIAMRSLLLLLLLTIAGAIYGCLKLEPRSVSGSELKPQLVAAANEAATKIDFATQVRPIFEARCQPCHFNGGKMFAKLPFDQPATIKALGEKLFTRIKDEREKRLIREFLAQD